MSIIDEYLLSLSGPKKAIVQQMYGTVRQMVPDATEEFSYAMPTFKYKDKGLVAIIANKNFLSLYPFCSVEKLGVNVAAFEQTKGSIHFSVENPISDNLFKKIINARIQQIESSR